jgi:hypothetical protein
MNKLQKLASKLRNWYRKLFIEVPEGYGDPVSLDVEKFQEVLHEKKEMVAPSLDGKERHEVKQG